MTVTSSLICPLLPTDAKGNFRSPCIKIAWNKNNVFTLWNSELCPEIAASVWIHEASAEREERIWIIVGLITWAIQGTNPGFRGKKPAYKRALQHCPILGKVSWSYQPDKARLPRKFNNTFAGPDWLIKDTKSIHHLPLQEYTHVCQNCIRELEL